ncbi:Leucine-rich repeat-containing protein 24 [Oryzias melastigma]|uniref:Leucine rich repeat containing 24 n=1 Tax=Oryzias melastigma TaxID=30732 RepID=A0A3B3DKH6_ORYME|nr:leucine-rich repeat-containing protein 24 [Oryzias melastigma]XP_024130147.1 leucine-rich repeat-containing protein 24 [Oryzias melastigma]XP_024130148.1 leucine-rich repeat-containing protein 24 [Oryzias melastigma]KAF6718445.1 Leucine-rich repeat-containing protein 24 [Oryzias melastigma]
MGLLRLPTLVLIISAFIPRRSLSCPSGCRCYSLTVECGSLGIKEVPHGIPSITETIFLQDNTIVQIRLQDLTGLESLHYLYLQNNSISALEPGAFLNQGQLLELALNGNLIHLVTPDMFQGLEHLRILYLAGNQITRIQDYTFRGLQRLQELHLQENSIELLAEHALSGLSSLALLDLSKNHLRTLGASFLKPLVSLQVLRVTENPWRCDCALGWLRTWISEDGQRLLSSAEQRRLMCSEPPRLSHLSLAEVAPNSLVCIPPVVQLEPSHLTVRLGESLRVSCQASGYPQPLVTWKKSSHGKAQLSPRGLFQELGPSGELFRSGAGGVVTALPSSGGIKVGGLGGINGLVRGTEEGAEKDSFDPDMGSGMLFLSNVTVAHAGRYECEAWNPGGVAKVTFHLAVNMSSSSSYTSQFWPRLNTHSYVSSSSSSFYQPDVLDISQEPLYEQDSMDFTALGPATQTAIAIGISLLALTAVLLLIMIYTRHQQYRKEESGSYCANKEESILYVNDYSDGPTTFAQLEEYRDDHGHEMYVLNRAKPVVGSNASRCSMMSGFIQQKGMKEALLDHEMVQTLTRSGGPGLRRNPADGGEGPLTTDPEELFLNQSLLFGSQVAYEIHC